MNDTDHDKRMRNLADDTMKEIDGHWETAYRRLLWKCVFLACIPFLAGGMVFIALLSCFAAFWLIIR